MSGNWVETTAIRNERYVYWVENGNGDIVMQPTFAESLAKNYCDYHSKMAPIHYFYVVRARLDNLEEMTA